MRARAMDNKTNFFLCNEGGAQSTEDFESLRPKPVRPQFFIIIIIVFMSSFFLNIHSRVKIISL